MDLTNDILRPITKQEVTKMLEICSNNIPNSIIGRNYLQMYLKNLQAKNDNLIDNKIEATICLLNLYTHKDGKLENCTIISLSNELEYRVYMYSNCSNELKECIDKTQRINWKLNPIFQAFQKKHHTIIKEIEKEKNLDVIYEVFDYCLYASQEKVKKFDIIIPLDVYVDNLKLEHVEIVNDTWPHKYPGSHDLIRSLILLNDTAGIFSKETNQLLCWALINDQFELG